MLQNREEDFPSVNLKEDPSLVKGLEHVRRDPIRVERYDVRTIGQGKDGHWSDPNVLGVRATLDITSNPALLRLASLSDVDQGFYKCRVDFKRQPTKTTRVSLTVVTPPERVSVMFHGRDESRIPVTSVVGPFLEGDLLQLTCIAHGGNPQPSVVWFEDTHLLDSHMESKDLGNTVISAPPLGNTTLRPGLSTTTPTAISLPTQTATEEEPCNTLTLGPLTRSDLKLLLTCEAANTNITLPTSVVVMVDMNLPPLSVIIRSPDLPLVAEKDYQVECEVRGSRPPPAITWWSGDERVLQATKKTSPDGNMTTSTLHFSPRPNDDNTTLRCIAENHATDTRMEDTWRLQIQYAPRTRARFGSSLDEENIKEGDDAYFECSIEANPRVSHVSWRHNNKVLAHNISGGVIISNQSLVLQRVSRSQAGRYSCHAHNVIGDGSSNTLRLDVKYSPICSPGQVTTYPVGRYEDAEVTCSVQANPLQASFQWTFNNTADTIDVPQGRFTSSSSHSVITYTPMTSLDYGTLLCWASNEIGTQSQPCVFHIVPAGKPDPPTNCTVNDRTQVSVHISCEEGSSGGLLQTFMLEASLPEGQHAFNVTSPTPSFSVTGLRAGQKYQLVIKSLNEKGASLPTYLTIASLSEEGAIYHPHDGPSEAEVRDGGKNGSGAEKDPEEDQGEDHGPSAEVDMLTHLLPVMLGLGGGLLLVSVTLILFLVVRGRRQRPPHSPVSSTSISHPPRGILKSPVISPKHIPKSSSVERELQVESESDADPDVIPLQESYHSPGCENASAATLLPPDRYKYAPLPVGITSMVNPGYTRLTVSPSTMTLPPPPEGGGGGGNDPSEGGGGGRKGGLEDSFPLPYDCTALLKGHQQMPLDPRMARSSTLPRVPSSSTSSRGGCRAHVPLDPHICPFPGMEGSLPPPPPKYQQGSAGDAGKSNIPMVPSPSAYDEEDTPTTPLLSKRESSV